MSVSLVVSWTLNYLIHSLFIYYIILTTIFIILSTWLYNYCFKLGMRLVSWKKCLFVCLHNYLFVFLLPREQTITALSCKSSLYTGNKGYTKPILHLCTCKLWFEGKFLFSVETQVCWFTTDFESGFFSGLFWHSTTEIYQGRPLRFLGNAYLVTLKVGVACTYMSKNEEQPKGFHGRIFEE